MPLLSAAEVQDLASRAIADGLANSRELLFLGFSPDAEARLRSNDQGADADLLIADIMKLNNAVEAGPDGFYLAIWLKNCFDQLPLLPARAAHYKRLHDQLEALARPKPPLPEETAPLPAAIRAGLGDADVDWLVEQLHTFIESMAATANDLMNAKRMHDKLHSIQGPLTALRTMMSLLPDINAVRVALRSQMQMISIPARKMAAELTELPAGDELAALGESWVGALRTRIDLLDIGLTDGTRADALLRLGELRTEVKEQMEKLAQRIETDRRVLNLRMLINLLRNFANKVQPSDMAAQANSAADALESIHADLELLGTQHLAWQEFDGYLWVTEDFFDNIGDAFAKRSFNTNWKKLSERLVLLAGRQPPEWFARNQATAKQFETECPVPIEDLPTPGSATVLEKFIADSRAVFFEIDLSLKSSCDRLGAITRQLSTL